MAVSKRTNFSGKIVWMYRFDAPGSKRENRILIRTSGFATKREAADAEAKRRIEEQQKYDLAKAGATGVAAALPQTLEMLMEEFFRQHVAERLAPKTMERYREQVAYLDAELLRMPLAEVTGLHLNREWSRLLKRGGHTRRNRTPRPISAKTVRNIAGVVSSAFGRATRWGLITKNPVLDSEPPVPKKHRVWRSHYRSKRWYWKLRRAPGA